MSLSIVIRSKDEADRLRLTLTSLVRQSAPAEVVVVNDGSSDNTQAVLEEFAGSLPLTVVHHAKPCGRSGASNAGARAATGHVLLFLDGDTLAHPDMVRHHATAHAERPGTVGRGERLHLRCTRLLQDPETGTPYPDEIGQLEQRTPEERDRLRVTRWQVLNDFPAVARRAEMGIYPGAGPRRLEELEMEALRRHHDCSVLWATASGSNLSVPRDAFLEVGGFNEAIDISEHRELALRLCQAGPLTQLFQPQPEVARIHRRSLRNRIMKNTATAVDNIRQLPYYIPVIGRMARAVFDKSAISPANPGAAAANPAGGDGSDRERRSAPHRAGRKEMPRRRWRVPRRGIPSWERNAR